MSIRLIELRTHSVRELVVVARRAPSLRSRVWLDLAREKLSDEFKPIVARERQVELRLDLFRISPARRQQLKDARETVNQ